VTTMYEMFKSAIAFNQDISNWNIENVADWENFGLTATAAITEFQNITDTSGTNKWNYFKYKFGNNLIKNSNLNGWDVTEATNVDNGPIWGYMGPEYLFDWSFNWGHNIVYNNEDGLNAWNNPSGLNINIPYFVALQNHGTYIRQTINITTTGTYTLTFLCARREPTAMSPPQDNVDIKIELTSTSTSNSEVIHTLSSTVFESFSTHYDIDATGDYTLTIYNNIGDASDGTADVFIANVEFFNGTTASSDLDDAVEDWINDSTTAEATYGHISKWDVSYVTNMSQLFKLKTTFNEDISNWDVSNVTNMLQMFDCWSAGGETFGIFNQDISGWNVSNVENMEGLLTDQRDFNQNLNNWDVSKVTNMSGIFIRCLPFNHPLDNWDVSNVTDMLHMFHSCQVFNQDISGWNVSNVTNIQAMFFYTLQFDQDISNWNLPTTNVNYQDYGLSSGNSTNPLFTSSSQYYFKVNRTTLTNSNIQTAVDAWIADSSSTPEYGGHISHWDVSNVTNMEELFKDKSSFNENIGGWDVSNVTDMAAIFQNASSFNQDISGWNVSNVTRMTNMFRNTPFNQNISSWVVSSVTGMASMFRDSSFNQPLNNWDVSNVIEMHYMFLNALAFNQDISDWSATAFSINTIFGQGSGHTNTLFWNGYETSPYYFKINRSPINDTNIQTLVDNWVGSDTTSTEVILYSEGQAGYGGTGNSWWNATLVSGTFTDYQSAGAEILTLSGVSHTYFIWNSSTNQLYSLETGANPVQFVNNSFNTYTFKGAHYGVAPPQYGGHISDWDVSQVTYMKALFQSKANFDEDLGNWDVSNVTTMSGMFRHASSFNNGGSDNIKNWNLASLGSGNDAYVGTDIFQNTSFNQDISSWTFSHEIHLGGLFYNTPFNQDISGWDISNATNTSYMFRNTPFNQDISGWDVSNVSSIGNMFKDNDDFDQDISGWDVSNASSSYGNFGLNASSMPTEFQNSNLYGYFDYTFGTDLINNSRFSYSTGGIEQVWGNMNVSNIRGWEVSNGVNVVENTVDGLNAWNNPSGLKRTFIGTPPSTINLTGNWGGYEFNFTRTSYTANSVLYTLYNPATGSPFGGYGIVFSIVNNQLTFYVNDSTYETSSEPSSFTINGNDASDGDIVNANDTIVLKLLPPQTETDSFTVPSDLAGDKNFVALQGHGTYIRQTINITTTGTHTLTFLCARREPEAMSIYNNFVPILIELTSQTSQTSVTHKLSSSVFESFSTDYVINATGDFTLTIYNAIGSDEKGTADVFIADVKFIKTSDARTELDTAITAWVTDSIAATATYGHISNWNVSNVTNMEELFKDKSSFNENIGGWDVSNVTDMAAIFQNASSFNQDISGWNVSNVTRMTNMFRNTPFNQNISSWVVSSVTGMASMFRDSSFNQPLNNWDVSNVIEMHYMFWNAQSFNQSLNDWNVSSVTNMTSMFQSATTFNEDISGWNTSNVTTMKYMFHTASAFNNDLNSWNVSQVTDMVQIFQNCGQFNQPLSNWNVSSVTNMNSAFANTGNFNQSLNSWNVSNVTNMGGMFNSSGKFNGDISAWNVSNVTSMSYMFNRCYVFNSNISGWDVSSVKVLSDMFRDATAFNADISSWNVSSVTIMQSMFGNYLGAASDNYPNSFNQDISGWPIVGIMGTGSPQTAVSNFGSSSGHSEPLFTSSSIYYFKLGQTPLTNSNIQTAVDAWIADTSIVEYGGHISNWDVSQVTNMDSLFESKTSFNEDISSWDVSNVVDMSYMFKSATTFDKDLDSWNVSSVKDMKYMFQSASAFNRPIGSWNISSVTKTQDMFVNASSFNQDISGWDVSNVTYMSFMFSNTPFNNGGSTGINNWDVSSVTTMWGMFKGATSFNQDISGWDVSNVTNISEIFRNATSFNQDISNWDVSIVTNFTNYGNGASSQELPDPVSGANFQSSLDSYFDVFS